MNRRSYLVSAGVVGAVATAGCLEELGLASGDTVLGAPDHDMGDPAHPIHGDDLPDFEEHDVVTGETLSRSDLLEDDRTILMTFIFSECPDGTCPLLLQYLRMVQDDAREEGYSDEVALVGVTFDPDTDTEEILRAEAEAVDLDLEAGNVHLLRPETNEHAEEMVEEDFGVPVILDDHDDHEEDDDTDDEDIDESVHYVLILLANPDGVVERAYISQIDFSAEEIIEDVRTVVDG